MSMMNSILTASLFISLCLTPNSKVSNIETNSSWTISNPKALEVYSENLIQSSTFFKQSPSKYDSKIKDTKKEFNDNGIELNNSFEDLIIMSQDLNDQNVDVKFKDNKTDVKTVVYKNNESNVLSLVEYRENKDEILLVSNGIKYLVFAKDGSYYVSSENKDVAPIHLVEDVEKVNIKDKKSMLTEARATRGTWSKMYGPFERTSKDWIQVIQMLNYATQLFEAFHPVIGKIQLVLDTVEVGASYLHTFYIYYYQQYMSDCQTYVKETNDYYDDPAHNKFVKRYIDTFHSVRPDYTGVPACMNYS